MERFGSPCVAASAQLLADLLEHDETRHEDDRHEKPVVREPGEELSHLSGGRSSAHLAAHRLVGESGLPSDLQGLRHLPHRDHDHATVSRSGSVEQPRE